MLSPTHWFFRNIEQYCAYSFFLTFPTVSRLREGKNLYWPFYFQFHHRVESPCSSPSELVIRRKGTKRLSGSRVIWYNCSALPWHLSVLALAWTPSSFPSVLFFFFFLQHAVGMEAQKAFGWWLFGKAKSKAWWWPGAQWQPSHRYGKNWGQTGESPWPQRIGWAQGTRHSMSGLSSQGSRWCCRRWAEYATGTLGTRDPRRSRSETALSIGLSGSLEQVTCMGQDV